MKAHDSRRRDSGNAFVPDPYDPANDEAPERDDATADFAEELGQEFLTSATTNIDITELEQDLLLAGENGGPYTTTSASEELADDDDPSNPPGATKEPFPTVMRGAGRVAKS